MKKLLVIALILASIAPASAQQDARWSQYMFNMMPTNPAYAGSRDAMSFMLAHRRQWTGFGNGAPITSAFSAHSPVGKGKVALGLEVVADKIGPKRNSIIDLTYAYRVKISTGKLAFALRTGLYTYLYNAGAVHYRDQGDPTITQDSYLISLINIDMGVMYHTEKFFVGASFKHLNNGMIGSGDSGFGEATLSTHQNLIVGRAFRIGDNLIYRPSILFKSAGSTDPDIDLANNFLLHEKVWIGFSFRSVTGVVLLIEHVSSNGLRAGYSFDINGGRVGTHYGGSHEVFLGFDLQRSRSTIVSPRYY